MLVDIPAAQHKTMFFIISLDLHVFIDNYPVQTASTTGLPRLCVRHHKETGDFLKPVTILRCRVPGPSKRAGVKEGGLADGRSVNAVFALLFGAVEGVINASDKLIQRFKVPLPKTAAERNPQVFFSPDAFFNSDTPRLQQ
jgi:hypothetical protein